MPELRYLTLLGAALLAGCALPGGSEPGGFGKKTGDAPQAAQSAATRQCLRELDATGATFTALPDRRFDKGCSNIGTVRVASVLVDGANLPVTNLGPVTCEVGQAFAGWARFGADRAARQVLGAAISSIETFGSYSCRNIAGSSRRSAHSTASAIDVAAFVLTDGRRITVRDGWRGPAAEREFLRIVQSSACRRFATVLGPEYNAAHRDHFHLEGVALPDSTSYCR